VDLRPVYVRHGQTKLYSPPEIRQLRDLMRYRFKLTNMLTGEKNRALNCLTVSNIKLDEIFSDAFGKSASSITNYILDHPGEAFDVTPFVDSCCETPIEEIQAVVEGAISPEQAVKFKQCRKHIDEIEAHRKVIEQELFQIVEPFSAVLDLLRNTPGLNSNPMTAIAIPSEIEADMSAFSSAKNLVSWAGCCPRNDQSGGKVKYTRFSRADSYLNLFLFR